MSSYKGLRDVFRGTVEQLEALEQVGETLTKEQRMRCEKPGCEETVSYTLETTRLFGSLTVQVCLKHIREWETDSNVLGFMGRYRQAKMRAEYAIYSAGGGQPAGTAALDRSVKDALDVEGDSLDYAVKWLATQ